MQAAIAKAVGKAAAPPANELPDGFRATSVTHRAEYMIYLRAAAHPRLVCRCYMYI